MISLARVSAWNNIFDRQLSLHDQSGPDWFCILTIMLPNRSAASSARSAKLSVLRQDCQLCVLDRWGFFHVFVSRSIGATFW